MEVLITLATWLRLTAQVGWEDANLTDPQNVGASKPRGRGLPTLRLAIRSLPRTSYKRPESGQPFVAILRQRSTSILHHRHIWFLPFHFVTHAKRPVNPWNHLPQFPRYTMTETPARRPWFLWAHAALRAICMVLLVISAGWLIHDTLVHDAHVGKAGGAVRIPNLHSDIFFPR